MITSISCLNFTFKGVGVIVIYIFMTTFFLNSILYGVDEKKSIITAEIDKSIILEKERLFRKDVVLLINEVIEKVQKNYPSISNELTAKDKDNLIKAIVSTLGRGIEYSNVKETPSVGNKIAKSPRSFPAIVINSQQVLYLRLDVFTKKIVDNFKKDINLYINSGNKSYGIILDLRNAQGGDLLSAMKFLTLFLPPSKIPFYQNKDNDRVLYSKDVAKFNSISQLLNLPVLILIGNKTCGAAEVFASIMKKQSKAMLLGSKGRGIPFEKEVISLNNGGFLKIPQLPIYLKSIDVENTTPAIKLSPYPQIQFKKLKKESCKTLDSDIVLQRAIDLIVCLHSLSINKKSD